MNKVYGRSPRNGLLPIVALKCASYKHPQYGKVLKPDLPIIGWHGTATTPAAPAAAPIDDGDSVLRCLAGRRCSGAPPIS